MWLWEALFTEYSIVGQFSLLEDYHLHRLEQGRTTMVEGASLLPPVLASEVRSEGQVAALTQHSH